MDWHPDIPDFPTAKPRLLERLEKLPLETLNAMTGLEIDEHVRDAAETLASSYHDSCKKNKDFGFDECVLFVAGALSQTGSSLRGHLGMVMVGDSQKAATKACRQYFPEQD